MRLWTTVNRWDLTTRSISSTSNAYLSIRKKDKERESLSLAAFGRSGRRRYFAPKARLLIRGPHTARPEPGPFVAAAPHILHHAPKRIEETNFLKRKRDVYTRRLWTRLHTSGVGPTPDKVWNAGRWEERSGGVMTRVQAVQSTSPPSRLVRVHLKPPRDRCKQRHRALLIGKITSFPEPKRGSVRSGLTAFFISGLVFSLLLLRVHSYSEFWAHYFQTTVKYFKLDEYYTVPAWLELEF